MAVTRRVLVSESEGLKQPQKHVPNTLMVHEIYASVQGESSFAGLRCAFIRLTGCNLRCTYCDTTHAFYAGERMPLEDVINKTLALNTPLVELTGGEPLLQPASIPLMKHFADIGRTVLLETSGERDISHVDSRVHRIMDLKTPSSGESHRNRLENIPLLTTRDEVKFVIGSREDYEFSKQLLIQYAIHHKAKEVLFSAVFGQLATRELVQWVMEDALPVRVQLQMHKYIWPPDERGV